MTYKNLCGWNPIPKDCTRIEGGNLSGVVFPTDREIIVDSAIYIKGEYPSNVIFLPSCTAVESTPIQEPFPVANPKLSAKAVLVINALIGSGKLDASMVDAIQPLVPAVNSIAGTEVELGQAATNEVIDLISELRIINTDNSLQLASQIEQALLAVQSIWEAQ